MEVTMIRSWIERPEFTFVFRGQRGAVFAGDFVQFGGMGFELGAAIPELRAAIEAARRRAGR